MGSNDIKAVCDKLVADLNTQFSEIKDRFTTIDARMTATEQRH
jgi:hypothetical protein